MAAAGNSLSKELECAICSEQLEQPKFIGPCNHTFCKKCVNKLWVSLERRRSIPCPECRRECPILQNGVDDLKDNFKLSNIIETYRKQQGRFVEIKCTLCPNGASFACKDCDFKLCTGCKCKHELDPLTRDHEIFGLCSSHGNGVFFFCSPCKLAVCSVCKVTNHKKGDYNVAPIRQVVDNLRSRIQVSSIELEAAVEEEDKKLVKLREIVRFFETRRNKMQKKLEQGRTEASTKITIHTESIANLTIISQELVDLVSATRESDTGTVIEKVTRSISELGLDTIVDMEQGMALISGGHQIRRGNAKRVFQQLKKVCNVTFTRHRPCQVVHRLRHLHVPDSRLATLGRSHAGHVGADTIYFHEKVSSSLTGTIKEGVHHATDMAVLSTGEVVVAREEKPPLRVFNPATGAYRDINITYDGEVIDEQWCVETEESDNMFVLTGYTNPPLLVVKPNGTVIQSVQLRGYASNMAFCSLNRILYIATDDRILRFHWSHNIIKEMSSFSHGVEGFSCRDVCIGSSGGEVLVAGRIGNGDIVVYQVTEGEDEEELVWRKIEYLDGVKRTSFNWPYICINDNNLWLGYGNKVEKFQLV